MERKGPSFTAVIDYGEKANEFTNKRMLNQSLHEQDEHVPETKTICDDGICARTTATDENYKQIFHEAYPNIKTIDNA